MLLQGTLDTAALWLLVAATGRAFYEVNPTAGMLFIPYQVIQNAYQTIASFDNIPIRFGAPSPWP